MVCNVFLFVTALACLVGYTADAGVKTIHINALSQTIDRNKNAQFDGMVDANIGVGIHVWADHVEVNKQASELKATSTTGSPIVFEDNSITLLASSLSLDLTTQTGVAHDVWLHVKDGFLFAKQAKKIDAHSWLLEEIIYTACDKTKPDWSIQAAKATFKGGSFVRASTVTFNIAGIPCFGVPSFIIPLQAVGGGKGGSRSGFLLPRFIIDYQYGFGIRQEYYQFITNHADTTVGINWRWKKGFIATDEFRWFRATDSSTYLRTHYGIVYDRYISRGDQVQKGTSRVFGVKGINTHFMPQVFKDGDVAVLMRSDFGTDKRIEYHFFNNTQEIDDTFYNDLQVIGQHPTYQYTLGADFNRTVRTGSAAVVGQQREKLLASVKDLKEDEHKDVTLSRYVQDRAHIGHLPHLELNTAYKTLGGRVHVRTDAFFDYVVYQQQEIERLLLGDFLVNEKEPLIADHKNFGRWGYRGEVKVPLPLGRAVLTPYVRPHFYAASRKKEQGEMRHNVLEKRIFAYGGYRAFVESGAQLALPMMAGFTNNGVGFGSLQPTIMWSFIPKMLQDNWYHVDRFDRFYPTNRVTGEIAASYDTGLVALEAVLQQGYDFYANADRFLYERSLGHKHALPLRCDFSIGNRDFSGRVTQEYDWPNLQLLQSEITCNFMIHKHLQCGVGYLFQNRRMQEARSMLSSIPHFILCNVTLPLSKRLTMSYNAQLYAARQPPAFVLEGIKPLIHRVRLEYDGHCWGFFIGFEEKKFKECGIGRNERAIVFSLRLDSLGSFAKKFKRGQQLGRQQE